MRRAAVAALVLLPLVGAGCSDDTVSTTSTGATGAGGGSQSASSSSKGSSGTTTGAGGGACAGSIDVVEDNGAPVHWTAICYGSWGSMSSTTPVGYLFSGGPAPGVQSLDIDGCENSGDLVASPGIHLSASNATGPGHYTMGSTSYVDMSGMGWGSANGSFDMTITKVDPVGGYIDGTFSGIVLSGDVGHLLSVTFHVCRVEDELAP